MRSYLVIPEGTTAYVVEASRPKHAASKARRGKGEMTAVDALVIPIARATSPTEPAAVIRGQLAMDFAQTAVG